MSTQLGGPGNQNPTVLTGRLGIGTSTPEKAIHTFGDVNENGWRFERIAGKFGLIQIDLQDRLEIGAGAGMDMIYGEPGNYVEIQKTVGKVIRIGDPFGDSLDVVMIVDNQTGFFALDGGTAIGQPTAPVDSAQLELVSTTKGFLQTRMTATQRDAIISPAAGLSVYNTTESSPDFYDGSEWLPVSPTVKNHFQASDTTQQTVSVASTFQTVLFDTNDVLDGWTHTVSTDAFNCAVAGTYRIQVGANVQKSGGAGTVAEFRLTVNGTPVGKTHSQEIIANNIYRPKEFSEIITAAVGDVLRLEMTGSTTNTEISAPVTIGSNPYSVKMEAVRLK